MKNKKACTYYANTQVLYKKSQSDISKSNSFQKLLFNKSIMMLLILGFISNLKQTNKQKLSSYTHRDKNQTMLKDL